MAKISNPLSEHSISALDIPSQKEWYKQQIGLYYGKCQELTKRIKELTHEYLKKVWHNNYLCFEIMQLQGKERMQKQKEWKADYVLLGQLYANISSMQVSLYISQKILNELMLENKKLYQDGGFNNEQ